MTEPSHEPHPEDLNSAQSHTHEPVSSDSHVVDSRSHQSVKVNLDRPLKNKKHRVRKMIFAAMGIIGLIMVGVGVYAYQFTKNSITDKTNQLGFFGQVHRILDSDVEPLKGEKEDRINVLLLGNGGNAHQGGSLTDTIMVASIKPSTHQVALLSIPRDLVVNFGSDNGANASYRKINNMVFLGGGGMDLAKEKIKDVTGLDIQYTLEVDFDAFRDIIDTLGGVDVNVENPFTDYEYPDYNYGYQTITFKTGIQHMEGEKALQFARSRHGNNGEGGDFARAARQQKILEAVREKLLSLSTVLNPVKISGLLGDLGNHMSTNMEIWEMLRFAEIAKDIDRDNIINQVVDDANSGLVHTDFAEATGASIVVPYAGLGDFSEIQAVAQHIFDTVVGEEPADTADETAVIAVQNGSSITGLATSTAAALRAKGFDVPSVGNGFTKLSTQTVVYDVSGSQFPLTSQALADYFGVTVITSTIPSATNSSVRVATDLDPKRVDTTVLPANINFVILLGSDAYKASTNTNSSGSGVSNSSSQN